MIKYAVVDPKRDDVKAILSVGMTVKQIGQLTNSDLSVNFNFAETTAGIPLGRLIVGGETVIRDLDRTKNREEIYMLPDRTVHLGKAPTEAVWAVQGTPPLLKGGKIVLHSYLHRDNTPDDIKRRAERVALGIMADGKLLIVRSKKLLFLSELAELMLEYGAVDALNGDGGGSAYLWSEDDGWGRKMGSALVVQRRYEMANYYKEYDRMSSPYGPRKDPITGKENSFHTGVDLVKDFNSPVYAFVDGEVICASEQPSGTGLGGFGITVVVKDKYGAAHMYAHLNHATVKVGERVTTGRMVGRLGSTGRSTGPHLHYEIRTKSSPSYGFGHHTDPTKYLDEYWEKERKSSMDKQLKTAPKLEELPPAKIIAEGVEYQGCLIRVDGTDRAFIPLRDVASALGATVTWDNPTKTGTIIRR